MLDRILDAIVQFIIAEGSTELFEANFSRMKAHEQRQILNSILVVMTKRYFGSKFEVKEDRPLNPLSAVSSMATLVFGVVRTNELLKDHIIALLTTSTLPVLDDSLAARRSVISAIAQDQSKVEIHLL